MLTVVRLVVLACVAMLVAPAAGVAKRRAVTLRAAEVFPSDRLTVRDPSQLTGGRVALPRPDCAAAPSDCADVDRLNVPDGFSMRIATFVATGGRTVVDPDGAGPVFETPIAGRLPEEPNVTQ